MLIKSSVYAQDKNTKKKFWKLLYDDQMCAKNRLLQEEQQLNL